MTTGAGGSPLVRSWDYAIDPPCSAHSVTHPLLPLLLLRSFSLARHFIHEGLSVRLLTRGLTSAQLAMTSTAFARAVKQPIFSFFLSLSPSFFFFYYLPYLQRSPGARRRGMLGELIKAVDREITVRLGEYTRILGVV